MRWHVIHVKPRFEKKMALYCEAHAIRHYLPLREETKRYQRRKVVTEKPVFPSYVFSVFDDDKRKLIFESRSVIRILEVVNQDIFFHELEQVRKALEIDVTLGACPAFTAGKLVKIISGPFMGVEGIIKAVKGKTKVILNVDMIGQGVAVEAETEFLEVIE